MNLQKFILGKTRFRTNEYKVKYLCFWMMIYFIIIMTLILMFGMLVGGTINTQHALNLGFNILPQKPNSFLVNYTDLTDDEIKIVQEMVHHLKPEYLYFTEELIFTKDMFVCNYECQGLNYKNKIYVEYKEDLHEMRETLCHELLHHFVMFKTNDIDDPFHRIIYDLERYQTCFDDTLFAIEVKNGTGRGV